MTGFNFILTILGLLAGAITTSGLFSLGYILAEMLIFEEEDLNFGMIFFGVVVWLFVSFCFLSKIAS